MTLSGLLIGGRPGDGDWLALGVSMIAVDTLVHNVLARTGVLAAFGAEHRYGSDCYGPNGCKAVLRLISARIDASRFDSGCPSTCPRFVQKALWRFATAGQLGVCNAANVGAGEGCRASGWYPVSERCSKASTRLPARSRRSSDQ